MVRTEHSRHRNRLPFRFRKRNLRKMARSDEQVATTMLRHIIVLGIDYALGIMIALRLKCSQKAGQIAASVALQSRHIFKNNEAWEKVLDKTLKFLKKEGRRLAFCTRGLDLAPVLTGTAPHKKKHWIINTEAKDLNKLLEGQLSDIPVKKKGRSIIALIGYTTLLLVINTTKDIYSGTAQAMSHAPRTTKKINGAESRLGSRRGGAVGGIHGIRPDCEK